MKMSTKIAYAEVDTILNLMDKEYIEMIPREIRYTLKIQKDSNYNKKIDVRKPLAEQNISRKALAILAVFNYEYWCKNEEEKRAVIRTFVDNENKREKELREKYNPDNLFKKERENFEKMVNETKAEMALQQHKESIFVKLLNKIKKIFKK